MIYKRFYFNIIIRVILIFLTCIWLSFSIQQPEKIYTLITITSVSLIQIISLINYINKTNRELARFFAALKDKDSSTHLHFYDEKGSFGELGSILNEIALLIGDSRIDSEKSSKYFEFVVEHIPIGILTINNSGSIKHSNKAIKNILQTKSLNSLTKLKVINDELAYELINLKAGEQKVIKIKLNDIFLQLLVKETLFIFQDETLKLISIQDVKNELEENELISWQRLIGVLTHEIMNSITPISTLTLAINKCLQTVDNNDETRALNTEDINDILINTKLIEERVVGLQEFVQKYRSLTKIQALKTSKFSIKDLLTDCITLFKKQIEEKNISIKYNVEPENTEIEADKKLLEQVIINLIKNAIESFEGNEGNEENKINLFAQRNPENRIEIKITDNGKGIDDEDIDQIFMPFFTTKEQGSGIGLSLARQIIRLHGGKISVQSTIDTGTTFTITL